MSETAATPGVVYLVGAGPGDPDLVTVRGVELLASADVVLHDELVHPALLEFARGEVRSVGKRGGDRSVKDEKQRAIEEELVAVAKAGKSVVRLKGGDPFLFGRGAEECAALASAGVRFEVVPGVASPIGASAYAGIALTRRDMATSVTFVSGTTRTGDAFDFAELAGVTGTICVLMAVQRLEEIATRLVLEAKRDPKTACAIVASATRAGQRVVEGELATIASKARAANIESPAIVIVGEVARAHGAIAWFERLSLFGRRVLVPRARDQASITARAIRRRGGEAIVLPLIEIVDPPDMERVDRAARELGGYDLVAFTSENGVERFFAAMDHAGLDARAFGSARVAAIGSGTAAALAARAIRADLVPPEFRGEALASTILADPNFAAKVRAGRARALVPRAEVARETLPEALRAAGCAVDVVPVYTTRPSAAAKLELAERIDARAIDAVLLTSSSIASAFADALGDRSLEGVVVASIGPVTTNTAVARGLPVAVTAEPSTIAGLLSALERVVAARSANG